MKKLRFLHLTGVVALFLVVLLLIPSVTHAFNLISFPGFKRAIKQYEKRAHWEPSFALTTDITTDSLYPSAGCECTVTTRYLELKDNQETADLKQWASFELTVVDRACEGDIELEQCYDKVSLVSKITAYVSLLQTHTATIFRYYTPGTEEQYTEHNRDFRRLRRRAIWFWEKYADQ